MLYGRVQTKVMEWPVCESILRSRCVPVAACGPVKGGRARLLHWLCKTDFCLPWLLGEVSVNYRTPSDFRDSAGTC